MSLVPTASPTKTPLSVGCYGAASSDITIVLVLMHGGINNPTLGEQFGVSQNKPSNKGLSAL